MKKNSPLYEDEIDLIALLRIIWNGKIKILLITIISFLLGFGYNSQIPRNYLNSLSINPSKSIEFIKFNNFQALINSSLLNRSIRPIQLNQSIRPIQSITSNQLILARFVNELKDYEEFLFCLKNTKKIKENFSNLKIEDQEIELFKYAKLLKIDDPKENENYLISFKWHDPEEAKKVLEDTLNLTSKNLRRLIDQELTQILEFERKFVLNKDRERLDYLKEQSAIAKELNILDNQIDNVNFTQSNGSLNISTADIAYYLRGYKAIDKEIELIQNRNYQNIKFIEKELNSFKKENIKFVDHNIHLINVKSLKNAKKILAISILLGLIVGIFYVLISNAYQPKKISKKNN